MSSRFSFEAIGTHWVIDIYQEISTEKLQEIEEAVRKRIALFEQTYSRFRSDSWLMKISKEVGKHELPDDAVPLFSMYRDVYGVTDGLVTPLIGQVLSDAGYDKEYSFTQTKTLTAPPTWDEAVMYDPHASPPSLTIKKAVAFDLGAIGKGYIIDIAGSILRDHGITGYCVDAGGDMAHRSYQDMPLRIGLEDPQDLKKAIGVIALKDASIAGSAGNRRKWGKFNHIINPKTLVSPDRILGVWVVADTTILADAMATALYFCKAEILLERFSFEYLILYTGRSVEGTLLGNPMLELF